MALRLFIGIEIPEYIAIELFPLQCGLDGAKFSPRENLHITLRFIGDLDEDKITDLDTELAKIHQAPFDISLKSVDFFGKDKPNSIHALVVNNNELSLLAQRCENACRKLGHEPETRKYMPHITLAYTKRTVMLKNVLEWKARNSLFKSDSFTIDRFYLYSSHMGKNGSHYRIEAEYPLK